MEDYSVLKKNKILPSAITWMILKGDYAKENKSDTETKRLCYLPYMGNLFFKNQVCRDSEQNSSYQHKGG